LIWPDSINLEIDRISGISSSQESQKENGTGLAGSVFSHRGFVMVFVVAEHYSQSLKQVIKHAL
jgi:hypothetical protein